MSTLDSAWASASASTFSRLADFVSSKALALALLHFLWQGTLVALLLVAANRALRRGFARARYVAACAALFAMLLLPAATVWRLRASPVTPEIPAFSSVTETLARAVSSTAPARTLGDPSGSLSRWIVLAWLAGVALLSVRFFVGCAAVRRLARAQTRGADPEWEERLSRIARRLRVTRGVRLLESALVRVPAAIGLLRPVILIPAGMATGMAPENLDALLAHELAHIRRADFLINLFQAIAETLLFYHPAVWWVSSRVRVERENACDDLAVAATGSAFTYARALVDLAQRRQSAPVLALSSDGGGGGELGRRILRLVVPEKSATRPAPRWLAGALALGAVLALGAAASVPGGSPAENAGAVVSSASGGQDAQPQQKPSPAPAPQSHANATARARPSRGPESRLEGATAAPGGLISPQDLIAFRIHDVTPEFIGEIVDLGYTRSTPDELVALRIQGATPQYIREMTALFGKLPLERFVDFRIHGVTPESAKGLRGIFGRLSPDDLVAMRIHGIDSGYVGELKAAGLGPLSPDQVVAMRIHGVTPEFVHALRAQGFARLSVDDLVAFRIHGVTPEFVSAVRGLGYTALTADDYAAFRIHGLTPESIRAINQKAGERLSADDLIEWRLHERRRPTDHVHEGDKSDKEDEQ